MKTTLNHNRGFIVSVLETPKAWVNFCSANSGVSNYLDIAICYEHILNNEYNAEIIQIDNDTLDGAVATEYSYITWYVEFETEADYTYFLMKWS